VDKLVSLMRMADNYVAWQTGVDSDTQKTISDESVAIQWRQRKPLLAFMSQVVEGTFVSWGAVANQCLADFQALVPAKSILEEPLGACICGCPPR
jgi:hypothetical protein